MSAVRRSRPRARLASVWVVGAAAGLLLGGAAARADEPGSGMNSTPRSADGAAIYRRVCTGCHMADARGAQGAGYYPALAGDPALASKTYAARVLVFGRHNMPAFSAKRAVSVFFDPVTLSNEQIAAVINHVRSHFGNRFKDTLTAAEVAAIDAGGAH